jgi:hypothetical protein
MAREEKDPTEIDRLHHEDPSAGAAGVPSRRIARVLSGGAKMDPLTGTIGGETGPTGVLITDGGATGTPGQTGEALRGPAAQPAPRRARPAAERRGAGRQPFRPKQSPAEGKGPASATGEERPGPRRRRTE